MGVARFEIEVNRGRGPTVRHEWSASQLLQSVARLQRANARGTGVLIRPAGAHGLVLVRELDASGLERLRGDGFDPAATVEIRPGAYEAWIKLSEGELPQRVRQAAGAGLARRCNGQAQADGEPPFGRLAGFTHPAPEPSPTAPSTTAWARDCQGRVAPAAAAYLAHVEQALDAARLGEARDSLLDAVAARPPRREQRLTRGRE